ncbi:hypothetical protein GWI33_009949 [Rhynchophorus ferrugineus]|uniref:Uncharacterized protein n=1 Tax=Rhynchophorus ferrugineus TaxID=354439 RepID=A0A834MNJ4_RHYFE|nr:hypothetical protein GWI33_009949 [Rhynchophorus ferrugineus]
MSCQSRPLSGSLYEAISERPNLELNVIDTFEKDQLTGTEETAKSALISGNDDCSGIYDRVSPGPATCIALVFIEVKDVMNSGAGYQWSSAMAFDAT